MAHAACPFQGMSPLCTTHGSCATTVALSIITYALLTEPGLSGCTSVMQKLMIEMSIRVTPTFCIFHHKEVIRSVTGISEDNLKAAIAEEDNVKAGPPAGDKPVEGCSAAQWTT